MAYNVEKLAKLGALKELGLKQKAVDEAQNKRIKALEDVGAQANVLGGVKVNGVALAIAEKMVDILVATGSKNGSISVAGTDVAIKGLAALAYKAKISQSDLDDALAAVLAAKADKATTLGGYGITDAYTKDEINAKISAVYKPAGSVVFSALPALAENVLGNVYNVTDAFTTTNNFVEGAGNKYPKGTNVVVVKVGDAYKYDVLAGFVDLSGYVEKEAGKGLSDENFTAALKDKLDGIAAGANKYVHPTHTAAASGLYKTTVDEEGHVTNTIPVTKDDITGLGIPAQDTTYDEATTAKAGLMSAEDKTKLDGMDTTIDKAIANHTATDAEVSPLLPPLSPHSASPLSSVKPPPRLFTPSPSFFLAAAFFYPFAHHFPSAPLPFLPLHLPSSSSLSSYSSYSLPTTSRYCDTNQLIPTRLNIRS